MKYDFDKIVDRHGTDCYKWDMIAKRKLPADTLPLWVADMDFETVPEVKERLKEVADRGIYGYSMLGDGYYHALKNWFSERFGWQVEKDWVIVTPGVVFALAAAVRAYTKEGDSVMIQRPVYHPFTNVVKENGRKLVNNPLVMENGKYHMDYEDMERKITEEQVKLFLLCSPHNPVSRVWTKEELCQAAEICKKHGVIMIVDEIHCDFVYEGYHHTSFGTLSEYADNAVICTAPSKTFNLAELQLSNIMIPNPELRPSRQRWTKYFTPMQTCSDRYPARQHMNMVHSGWMNYVYICRETLHTSVIIWQSICQKSILSSRREPIFCGWILRRFI